MNNNIQKKFAKGLKSVLSDDKCDEAKILNFNSIVEHVIQSEPNVCSSGCAWCCYQPVDIYPKEKLIITKYIVEKLSQIEREFIQDSANHYIDYYNTIYNENIKQYQQLASKNDTDVGSVYEYMLSIVTKKPIKCPFLRTDNTCLIYPVRPLMCRTHAVSSEPDACIENYHRTPSPHSRYISITAHHILKEDNNHTNPIALVRAIAEVIGLEKTILEIEHS